MAIGAYTAGHTHRQHITWLAWLSSIDRWNEPSRSDWYAMQIAAAIQGTRGKKVTDLSSLKIPFKFQDQKPQPELSKEEKIKRAAEIEKMRWAQRLGMTPVKRE